MGAGGVCWLVLATSQESGKAVTGPELQVKLDGIVFNAGINRRSADHLLAEELHKIADETHSLLISLIAVAPCSHPVAQRWKKGTLPNIVEVCGVCSRDVG